MALAAPAQEGGGFSARARIDAGLSFLHAGRDGAELLLVLSQPVPWRVVYLADPLRVAVDFREAILDPATLAALVPSGVVSGVAAGRPQPGWTRLELTLAAPLALTEGALETAAGAGGRARLRLRLARVPEAAFLARVAAGAALSPPPLPGIAVPPPPAAARTRPIVALDPGHGGIDPGAERDGRREADIVLGFARELAEILTRSGRVRVALTRSDDGFVSLERRLTVARDAGAKVFVSLHADAIEGGGARGATVYTLADEASDAASAALAERHDRSDLLAGVDLRAQDDRIAGVLMEMARRETRPRSAALADALVAALDEAGVALHERPRLEAAFSVLKAPDVPSVLVELGFMSSARDLANLTDPAWRRGTAEALAAGILAWVEADALAQVAPAP